MCRGCVASGGAVTEQPSVWRRLLRGEAVPALFVLAVVAVANALYLSGRFDPNPMSSFAALGSIVRPGALGGLYTIDPNAGFTSQALGHLAAVDIVHGRLPWWNPYEGAGGPLAGEMQSAALFPPTILLWFSGGQLAVRLLLEAVAGLAMLRLLRRLDVGVWVASALACAFALDGTFAWLMHAPANEVAALPLLLLGIERARDAATGGRRFGFALVAVALAVSAYAGFPETAYLNGILAVVWALVRVPLPSRRAALRYVAKLVAGLATGALLAAPIVVAFADYLPYATAGPHNAGVFDLVHVARSGAGALFFPYVFGPIFGFYQKSTTLANVWSQIGGYLTTSLLALDLLALWGRRLRGLRVALASWLVLALGRAYGVQPLWRVFDLLPYMAHVGAYRYLWPSIELASCALAALGLDDLRRGLVSRWAGASALLLGAGIAAGTVAAGGPILSALSTTPHAVTWARGSLVWGFAVIAVIGGVTLVGRGRWRTVLVAAIVVVDALAMFVLPELSAPRSVTYDSSLVAWLESHTGLQRLATLGPLQPNYGSYFGLMEVDVNDVPTPKAYERYVLHDLDPNTGLSFTGTVVKNPSGPTPLQELERHLSGYEAIGVKYVIVLTGAVPPASVATLGIRRMYGDHFATVFRLPHPSRLYAAGPTCRLSHESLTSVDARCTRNTRVVRRELWLPGTVATIDEQRSGVTTVDVRRAGLVAGSVVLPSGTSRVMFSYGPPHENLALGACALGALALCTPVIVASGWRRRRRRRKPTVP